MPWKRWRGVHSPSREVRSSSGLSAITVPGMLTLVKIIAGALRPDEGTMSFDEVSVTSNSPSEAAQRGIHTVYQDLALCDNLDVVANLFLGHELVAGKGPYELRHLSEDEMEVIALEVLAGLKVTTLRSVRVGVGSLSGGQRQAIAIARAVLRAADLIMLDETDSRARRSSGRPGPEDHRRVEGTQQRCPSDLAQPRRRLRHRRPYLRSQAGGGMQVTSRRRRPRRKEIVAAITSGVRS